jgi:glycerophosphoryl diester phosphodiesterase
VRSGPRIVAHRGASEAEAEHTLAAYERALADGADGLECDVRLTRDGVLVCVHDRRIDRTSSGRGVVSTLELADLAELDFASWHPRRDPVPPVGRGEHDAVDDAAVDEAPEWDRTSVLTLDRLIEVVAACDRPIELAIETKHPTRYAGLVELTLVETLARHGLTGSAQNLVVPRVMSFSVTSLRRLRGLAPTLPTVYLMDRLPLRLRSGSLPAGALAGGPALRLLRAHPDYVERVHDTGGEVHVWTVDDPADVEFVAGIGVDVIITNRPAAVRRQLEGESVPARSQRVNQEDRDHRDLSNG